MTGPVPSELDRSTADGSTGVEFEVQEPSCYDCMTNSAVIIP